MNLENLVRNFQADPENDLNSKNLALLLNRLGKFEGFVSQYSQEYKYFNTLRKMALFLGKRPIDIDIKKLPEGEITLEFDTDDIAEQFNFGSKPDFDDVQSDYSPTDRDIIELTSLKKDKENWLDADGEIIDEDILYDLIAEIKNAYLNALDYGTEGNANKAYTGAIENCLEHFSHYKCDYDFEIPDEEAPYLYQEEENIVVKATGITEIEAFIDIVRIKANTDLVHIINNHITDDGYSVYQYLDESIEDYILSNFGSLNRETGFGSSCNRYTWEQEFDSDHFEERVKEIETQYEVRIL